MASAPAFTATANIGAATVSTANTNRDGTGTIATVFTAGASGSRIEELVLKATGDPADSVVTVFLHNGSTYFLFDEVDLGDPAAASTTVAGYRLSREYKNLVLPTSWSLRCAITVALTAGVINAIALGGDF
jgi:hypothetical protein